MHELVTVRIRISVSTLYVFMSDLDVWYMQGQVKQKVSSGGKYVSVNIGPVQVVSSEQVYISSSNTPP